MNDSEDGAHQLKIAPSAIQIEIATSNKLGTPCRILKRSFSVTEIFR
jgi:hypothetical protein